MAMCGGEEYEVVGLVSQGFGGGVEDVARDDYGGGVGGAAALGGDTAGVGGGEAELRGEAAAGRFFDDGEGGGDLEDV